MTKIVPHMAVGGNPSRASSPIAGFAKFVDLLDL